MGRDQRSCGQDWPHDNGDTAVLQKRTLPSVGRTDGERECAPFNQSSMSRTCLMPHDSHSHSNFLKSHIFSLSARSGPTWTLLDCTVSRRA